MAYAFVPKQEFGNEAQNRLYVAALVTAETNRSAALLLGFSVAEGG